MDSNTDLLHEPRVPSNKNQRSFSRSLKPLALLTSVLFIAVVAGAGGYLLLISTRHYLSRVQPSHQRPPVNRPTPVISTFPPSSTTWVPYLSEEGWRISYPADMTLRVNKTPSRLNPYVSVTAIGLSGRNSGIGIESVPNPRMFSVDQWLEELRSKERATCQVDSPIANCGAGFSSPAEHITIANRPALVQYLHGAIGTVNVYLSVDGNTILWASGSTFRKGLIDPVPSAETRNLLLGILETLSEPSLKDKWE